MNRAERMLSVLEDRQPHSRRDIFERVGFMLTNNAASELRSRGLHVDMRRERGIYIYQLQDSAPANGPLTRPSSSIPLESGGSEWAGTGAEQLTLRTGYEIREGSRMLRDRFAA